MILSFIIKEFRPDPRLSRDLRPNSVGVKLTGQERMLLELRAGEARVFGITCQ
jgi:hypothetical protein